MKNVIYEHLFLDAREGWDGESPMKLFLTEEINGYAIILIHPLDERETILKWYPRYANRDRIIEVTVDLVRKMNKEFDELLRTFFQSPHSEYEKLQLDKTYNYKVKLLIKEINGE